MSVSTQVPWIKVWDPLVCYGQWALVAAFSVAYLSAEEDTASPDQPHVWGGYAVGAIRGIRVIRSFFATRHAQFSDFAVGSATALRYFGDELRRRAGRHVGHCSAAAAMIFALLICLIGTAGTRWVVYGNAGQGPLASATGAVLSSAQAADREDHKRRGTDRYGKGTESAVGDIHGILANITLGLIILHILGVGLASVMHRENLVAFMFSGRKRGGE